MSEFKVAGSLGDRSYTLTHRGEMFVFTDEQLLDTITPLHPRALAFPWVL